MEKSEFLTKSFGEMPILGFHCWYFYCLQRLFLFLELRRVFLNPRCIKRKDGKSLIFLQKSGGITPLKNANFCVFYSMFFRLKRLLVNVDLQQKTKTKDGKSVNYLTITMDEPRWKKANFGRFKSMCLWSKKASFLSRTSPGLCLDLFCIKTKDRKSLNLKKKNHGLTSFESCKFCPFF